MNPSVPAMYKMFYIDGDLKYYTDESMLEGYVVDKQCDYCLSGDYYNQGIGWDSSGEASTWALGEETTFFFNVDKVDDEKYVLEIDLDASLSFHRSLYVNGKHVCEIDEDTEVECWKLDLPSDVLVSGVNKFTILTSEDVLPQSEYFSFTNDERELNFAVKSVMLQRK